MKSVNFEILRDSWPELAVFGGFAESYAHADPASALVKLRLFAENLTRDIYRDLRLPKPDQPAFVDLLKNDAFAAITPKVVLDKLHALRIHGNKAAHGEPVRAHHVLWLLKEAHDLARWFCIQYGKAKADQLPAFTQPVTSHKADARERRQILEKLAAQEAQMEAHLAELDEACSKAGAAEKEAAELKELASTAQAAADELHFSEAETRTRLIDSFLASAGWDVGEGLKSIGQVGKEVALDGQPTATGTGYADYVLWDDNGNPLAVIEAKKTAVDAERGRHQAKLYADSLEEKYRHPPCCLLHQRLRHLDLGRRAELPAAQALRLLFKG